MNIAHIYTRFPTRVDCIAHLEKLRWKGRPRCPYCLADRSTPYPAEQRYHCNSCNTTFSVTVQTIFHHTHLPLQTWFLAIALVLNATRDIPARRLAHDLAVNKNTAWYVMSRIRKAMMDAEQRNLLHRLGVTE